MSKLFVISLGGSLINPGEVDVKFLKDFRRLILAKVKKGNRFILITGGGALCRHYQQALSKIARPSATDLDWLGIYTTRLNAQLIRLMFNKLTHASIVEDPNKTLRFNEKVLVGGGWTPGRSTDDDAVRLAKIYGAKVIINLSNIDYVYTKDPKKFKNAKKIENISWNNYLKLIGKTWRPGANLPFDPTAAKFAKQNKLKVIIANGKNLRNLKNILSEKKNIGTIIQ